MTEVLTLRTQATLDARERAVDVLETGGVVLLPDAPFAIAPEEGELLDPSVLKPGVKNVSLNAQGRLGGVALQGEARDAMAAMVGRYAVFADTLLEAVAPSYGHSRERRRTSYRPGSVATRVLSARKDDRRLHVDAFASSPVAGRRILRVFTNVDPSGDVRTWRVGDDDFIAFATGLLPRLRGRSATVRRAMALAGLTRGYRTAYDQAMLELHDHAKLDDVWQAKAAYTPIEFPSGASWIVYTDSVLHAATAGRHAFEQTYLMDPAAMQRPDLAPLSVLERLLERSLV